MITTDEDVVLCCSVCGEALDLVQPAVNCPDRLIGVCQAESGGCNRMFFLRWTDDGYDAILLAELPPCGDLQVAARTVL